MKRIVVIDDSEIVLDLVKAALDPDAYEVTALLEPDRTRIPAGADLVMVDINMPQIYGDDLPAYLREACGVTAPIYLFSDVPETELAERAHEAGADGYVWKGWGIARVVEEVERLFSGRRQSA